MVSNASCRSSVPFTCPSEACFPLEITDGQRKYCLNFPSVEYSAHEPLLHWQTKGKNLLSIAVTGGPFRCWWEPPAATARSTNSPHPLTSLFLVHEPKWKENSEIHRYVQVQAKTKREKSQNKLTFSVLQIFPRHWIFLSVCSLLMTFKVRGIA